MKNTTPYHCKYCAAGFGFKAQEGSIRCNEYVHLDEKCWDMFHDKKHFGMRLPRKVVRRDEQQDEWQDSILGSNVSCTNVVPV
eukprot:2319656-Ditylum_brightwellii.AAC.1